MYSKVKHMNRKKFEEKYLNSLVEIKIGDNGKKQIGILERANKNLSTNIIVYGEEKKYYTLNLGNKQKTKIIIFKKSYINKIRLIGGE